MPADPTFFTNDREAVFLRRPNRFLIIAGITSRGRIGEWLSGENLHLARERTLPELFALFGSQQEPIAILPTYYAKRLDPSILDDHIYSSKAYFLDHAARHHQEVPQEDYLNIQDTIDSPDAVWLDSRRRSLTFLKKYDNYGTVAIGIGKKGSGKLTFIDSWRGFNTPLLAVDDKGVLNPRPTSSGEPTSPLLAAGMLIWFLHGNAKALEIVTKNTPFKISVVTYMELLQGMKSKRELLLFKKYFREWRVEILQINETISAKAMFLVENYFLSNSLELGDALIGVTALEHGETIVTGNVKHYKVIPHIRMKAFVP
jgi:predicted nucleic acid-binding protein